MTEILLVYDSGLVFPVPDTDSQFIVVLKYWLLLEEFSAVDILILSLHS
jgi:hypothetical protein